MSEDVIEVGRKLLASGRISTGYAPVLSTALKELEQARSRLKEMEAWAQTRCALCLCSFEPQAGRPKA